MSFSPQYKWFFETTTPVEGHMHAIARTITTRQTKFQFMEIMETLSYGKCLVLDGRITRAGDTQARLLRDNVVVYEGKIGSLRRFKDDVSEVKSGFECGIGFERYNDIKVGDVIEVFVVERVAAPV